MSKYTDAARHHKFTLFSLGVFLLLFFLITTYIATQRTQTLQSQAAGSCPLSWMSPQTFFSCSSCRCVSTIECSKAGIAFVGNRRMSPTCASARKDGVFCDDPRAPDVDNHSVGSLLTLTTDPTTGSPPLNVTLTAVFKNSPDLSKQTLSSGKQYQYNFWWDCNADARIGGYGLTNGSPQRPLAESAHYSVTTAQLISGLERQCGVLPQAPAVGSCATNAFGARCTSTALQQTVTHAYQTAGNWQVPRVFVDVPGYSVILWNSQGGLQSPPDAMTKIYPSCGPAATPTPTLDPRQQILQRLRTITPFYRR